MRAEVAESWQRSAAAGVDVDQGDAPVVVGGVELRAVRDAHPLAVVRPVLDDVLGQAVVDCGAAMAITDAAGTLLWLDGSSTTKRRAERIGFVEGSCWDERAAGTNAPGLALTTGRPATVTGPEHFCDRVRPWSCVATPIHGPEGEVLGVLDVTGGDEVAVPQTMGMVRAAARLAEAELARAAPRAPGPVPSYAAPTGRPVVLECLGRDEASLLVTDRRLATREVRLRPRHAELLLLLASRPLGVPGDELAALLYPEGGQGGSASTLRAEVNRLRQLVGDDLVASRPYRLPGQVAGDWLTVEALLAAGEVRAALRGYPGPLLPHSRAPGVVELREDLEASLRQAVLRSGQAELLGTWTRSAWGRDDHEMWAAQRALLTASSPLRPLVEGQLRRLDRLLGRPSALTGRAGPPAARTPRR